MKILILILTIAFTTTIVSCNTAKKCGYEKAKKFNARQMKKSYRHNH